MQNPSFPTRWTSHHLPTMTQIQLKIILHWLAAHQARPKPITQAKARMELQLNLIFRVKVDAAQPSINTMNRPRTSSMETRIQRKDQRRRDLWRMVTSILVLEMEIRSLWFFLTIIWPLTTAQGKERRTRTKISATGPASNASITTSLVELTATCVHWVKYKARKCFMEIAIEQALSNQFNNHNINHKCSSMPSLFSKRNQWCLVRCLYLLILSISTENRGIWCKKYKYK